MQQMPQHNLSHLPPYYQQEFTKIAQSGESYKGKWNWAAFFFGPIWALTKGAWLSALLHIGLNAVILVLSCGFGLPIVFVGAIIYGLRGNYIYYYASRHNKQLPS
jgi:hypothetical protein